MITAGNSVWTGFPTPNAVVRIDATTIEVLATTLVGATHGGALTVIDGRLWVTRSDDSTIVIDLQMNKEVGTVRLGGVGGGAFSVGGRVRIAVTDETNAGRMVAVDPETLRVGDAVATPRGPPRWRSMPSG